MKKILIILFIAIISLGFTKIACPKINKTNWINGEWEWTKTKMGNWFTIYMNEGMEFPMGPTEVKGAICSGVSEAGINAVDCCGDNAQTGQKILTIHGNFSENSWTTGKNDEIEVSFATCFGSGMGEALIKKIDTNTISWKITKQPAGGCSIPENGILKKKKNEYYDFIKNENLFKQ